FDCSSASSCRPSNSRPPVLSRIGTIEVDESLFGKRKFPPKARRLPRRKQNSWKFMRTLKGFLPTHEDDATEEELLQLQGERVNIEGDHENEHLKSEAKAEKEMKRLRELLSIIDDAARVPEQQDLKLERARRFTAALGDISSPYEELYDQKSRNCKQLYMASSFN
ncbi:hypothetical protein M513_12261, partial [Trichuris suis]